MGLLNFIKKAEQVIANGIGAVAHSAPVQAIEHVAEAAIPGMAPIAAAVQLAHAATANAPQAPPPTAVQGNAVPLSNIYNGNTMTPAFSGSLGSVGMVGNGPFSLEGDARPIKGNFSLGAVQGAPEYPGSFGGPPPDDPNQQNQHSGVDFKATPGTPVQAPEAGFLRSYAPGGVNLKGDSGVLSEFGHMRPVMPVGQQGRVNAGDVVGYVDNVGVENAWPAHLHYDVVMPPGQDVQPTANAYNWDHRAHTNPWYYLKQGL